MIEKKIGKMYFLVLYIKKLIDMSGSRVELELIKEDILNICHIDIGDREYEYDLYRFSKWIRRYFNILGKMKDYEFLNDIIISFRSENRNIPVIYIMDSYTYNNSGLRDELIDIRRRRL